ncbi:hypothetical protein RD792_001197 [Penstemon davidsonii]|uniref:Pentatricopeptide repeat-containing protein n=1 Tax=Penstemon davidsonii TaxID=160366 RepID=A0ABR0DMS8_9LAMI|nr:hypothetical protein RD792_001197 [Penstemon davidsonii]
MMSKCYKETITAIKTITQDPIHQLIKLNCLLKNLNQSHQFSDALNLFQQIHSSHHLKPDHYTLSTALTVCASLHNTTVGSQLHAHSIQSGLRIFPHVANTLLSLYAKSQDLPSVKTVFHEIKKPDVYSYTTFLRACTKLGEIGYARQVFDELPQRDVAVWNAIITGCVENGHDGIAFDLFRRMHVLGVQADNYTFASVLSLCSLEKFDVGKQVHSLVVKTGFLTRSSVINSLLSMYFNCNSDVDACGVFEEVGCKFGDEITYNAIIAGFVSIGRDEEALMMFKDMHTVGLKPTELTFVSVMGACLCFKTAIQVHGEAIKSGFVNCTAVNNAAITMYSNSGDFNAAFSVFNKLEEKDIVSWNAIIASYAQENMGSDAMSLYLQMQRNGIDPDEYTIGSLLSNLESVLVVEMIQAIVIKKALIVKTEVSNALLSAFSKYGEINQANKLFFEMYYKNIISWNAIISGFQLNGLHEHGFQKFFEFLESGLRPNHYTLSLILSICASISDLQRGKQIHAYIIKFGYFSNTLLGNALISLYAKCGDLYQCLIMFHSMTEKDVVSWNSIISAYAQHGEGEKAIQCFNTMQYSSGIRPDEATFTAILSACSHSGLVADGIKIFNTMVSSYGIEPKVEHFSCIVDILGRAGFLDVAERLIEIKGMDIDSTVWWTLLSSCAANGHLQLGIIIAEFLIETGNVDPTVYVLLSNLYANVGKWQESANVRELMNRNGVMKQPGSSWISS